MKQRTQISQEVDIWIADEELPSRANFRPVSRFDDLFPDDPDEVRAYWDFQKWGMTREHLTLASIPNRSGEPDFWLGW